MARSRLISPTTLALITAVGLVACSGANCPKMGGTGPKAPRAIVGKAEEISLADLIRNVNDNSARVHIVLASNATIEIPQTLTLQADLAMERPNRFRMQARTRLTGPEMDVGSNDYQFWFWIGRDPNKSLYYCRHDQFAGSAAQQVIPVEPQWLLDAMGLPSFDPQGPNEGPFKDTEGRLVVVTHVRGPAGERLKFTVIDPKTYLVLEQHLYDRQKTHIASSFTSKHERDYLTGAYIPQTIEIQWPPTDFSMKINLGTPVVDQPASDPVRLWNVPFAEYRGYKPVDLGDPNNQFAAPIAPPPAAAPPAQPAIPQAPTSWWNRLMGG